MKRIIICALKRVALGTGQMMHTTKTVQTNLSEIITLLLQAHNCLVSLVNHFFCHGCLGQSEVELWAMDWTVDWTMDWVAIHSMESMQSSYAIG